MIWIVFLLAIFRPQPLLAQSEPISIEKYSPIGTSDWVQIKNSSTQSVDLSGYSISNNGDRLKKTPTCVLLPGKSYRISFGNSLYSSTDNPCDKVILKKGDSIIDSSSYFVNTGCTLFTVEDGTVNMTGATSFNCVYLEGSTWIKQTNPDLCTTPLDNDPTSCIALPTTTPSPAPSPTPSPTSSAAPSATSAPSANPSASVNISNSSLKINQNYEININLSNLSVGHSYAYKAFGGKNDSYGISTQKGSSWLNYNSAWADFPVFLATSSTVDNLKLIIKIDDDEPTGSGQLKVKVKDQTQGNDFESPAVNITIIQADPTGTPTPKTTTTPSITQTPTPEPTAYLEPLPTDGLFLEPTQSSGLIAGLSDSVLPSPTPKSRSTGSAAGVIPIFLVTVGGLFLTAPMIISKIKPA